MVTETVGDLLTTDVDIIVHQVNCLGIMDTGVARQVREKYPEVNKAYCDLCQSVDSPSSLLGSIQVIPTLDGKRICNLFGQVAIGRKQCMTEYDAVANALNQIKSYMEKNNLRTVAFPKYIGCGLAGGNWDTMKDLIEATFEDEAEIKCLIVAWEKEVNSPV